jgi:translation initiation factor 5A
MMIDGEPCRIVDIAKSKPGKHGAAKARIVAIGVFDNHKKTICQTVDATAEIPIIDKRAGQVFSVNPTVYKLWIWKHTSILMLRFQMKPN